MLKKIIIALVSVVAVFLIVVAVQPDSFSMERSACWTLRRMPCSLR